jgi:murein DD-endopeptidase MepM/ murein hydrolase activator NlpD
MARGPNPLKKFKNIGVITSRWGEKTDQESFHPGVDIANTLGTPIPSTVKGQVTQAEGGHVQGENNFGNTVEIKDADGNLHQFHHLQNINVTRGQRVKEGQQIATLGNSGATYSKSGKGSGANLDYRIVSAAGKYLNPMTYLQNL